MHYINFRNYNRNDFYFIYFDKYNIFFYIFFFIKKKKLKYTAKKSIVDFWKCKSIKNYTKKTSYCKCCFSILFLLQIF